ncbi:fibulin-1-like, partial [Lingula anatina]|uniref:Fibulin-1-like n=1 Tax=Lingula anatina TaxID=7574 RepID=A0A1S3IJ67_LINAN
MPPSYSTLYFYPLRCHVLPNSAEIDECAAVSSGCAHRCSNTFGGFQCSCNAGYTLDDNGKTCNGNCANIVLHRLLKEHAVKAVCKEIGECQQSMCSHFCTNTNGSFTCTCQAGYLLNADGVTCDDVDECSTNNGGCAQVCNNLPGSFQCECSSGYQFGQDGITCEDINECNSFNGGCQDICENTIGSFVCNCSSGVLDSDGLSCDPYSTSPIAEPSVFQLNSIARELLPQRCAVVTLTRCTESADVEVRISSTDEWYKLNSDPNVIFTLGIVFVEVHDIVNHG